MPRVLIAYVKTGLNAPAIEKAGTVVQTIEQAVWCFSAGTSNQRYPTIPMQLEFSYSSAYATLLVGTSSLCAINVCWYARNSPRCLTSFDQGIIITRGV
jgi:hypothetical protein